MEAFSELIESELSTAILHTDKEAIRRLSLLLSDVIKRTNIVEKELEENKSDIRALIEVVKQGFDSMYKRFEDINKRFNFIELLLVVIIGVVVGINIYAILRQNKWYLLKSEMESEIIKLKEEQKKLKEIVIELAKKDKTLWKKLKIAGFL